MRLLSRQFIGNRLEADEQYVTTEFIAVLALPIWPVASYRVLGPKLRERTESVGETNRSSRIQVLWSQAIEGWLLTMAIVGMVVFLLLLAYVVAKNGWNIN